MSRLCALVLGAVLVFAGGAKLASPTWPAQARELGAPGLAVPIVPWLELVLGAALLAGLVLPVTGSLAGLLLVGFTGLLVVRLGQGRRPPCACFGGRTARPLGPWSVVRNLALIALAAGVVAG